MTEALSSTSLLDRDSDDDGRFDGTEDADHDGVFDVGETHPLLPDTDADGICDGVRIDGEANGLDATSACTGFEGPVFVRASALAGGRCMNWSDACTTPGQAMAIAVSGAEVWIAEGTYRPSAPKASVLVLKSNVAVYGGFAGTEGTRAMRRMPLRPTILSGDFSANDPVVTDNSVHVVYGNTVMNVVLDGVIVTAGRGGAFNAGDDAHGAGIMLIASANAVLDNVHVEGNVASREGGGIYCGGLGTLTIRNALVRGNSTTSENGGGLYNNCTTSIYSSVFSGNVGAGGGGAIANPGTLVAVNSVFLRNQATIGGAIFVGGTTRVTGCTFYENSASNSGGAIRGINGSLVSVNNVFWGNTAPLLAPDWNGSMIVTESYTFSAQPVTGTGSVQLTSDPFVLLASGVPVLAPASPPVDGGSDAAADDVTYGFGLFGIDFRTLSTRADGALDVTPVDAGYHLDPNAPVIVALAATSSAITWQVRSATR